MTLHSKTFVAFVGLIAMGGPSMGCSSLKSMFGGNKAAAYQEPTPDERRQAFVAEHGDLSPDVREAILAGHLIEGMDHDQVKASLGRPIDMDSILPETPEGGDESWGYEEVAYGTKTDYEPNGPRESRIFSGVRDTRVRFYRGKIVGVDDLGYTTRDEMNAACHGGSMDDCNRLDSLQARAAAGPPPSRS